jgi:hypothetical protein
MGFQMDKARLELEIGFGDFRTDNGGTASRSDEASKRRFISRRDVKKGSVSSREDDFFGEFVLGARLSRAVVTRTPAGTRWCSLLDPC